MKIDEEKYNDDEVEFLIVEIQGYALTHLIISITHLELLLEKIAKYETNLLIQHRKYNNNLMIMTQSLSEALKILGYLAPYLYCIEDYDYIEPHLLDNEPNIVNEHKKFYK